jgi:hypothetical protein
MTRTVHAYSDADGGRFADLSGQAAISQAVADAGRTERVLTATLILGGAWLVARSPALRRVVWRVAREAATTWIPVYLVHEITAAWRASARRLPHEAGRAG